MRPRVDVMASPVWINVRRSKLTPYSILFLFGLAACDDELSLHVDVAHPPAAAVASTVVSIYESNTATCRQLEFGDLSEAELAAILVAEQTIGGDGALDGISRLDRKLVAARGFDATGRLLTAGCTEHAEITGRDVVTVATDFAATLSIGGRGGGNDIPITLTDADGRPLDGHPVAWRVYGPAGAAPALGAGGALVASEDDSWELAAPACTRDGGGALLHPVPPSRVGGFAIEIRPSWSAQPNARISSFTRIDPTLTLFEPKPGVVHPCAIRVAGTARRLVCLQLTAETAGVTVAREYAVTVVDGNARLQQAGQVAVDATAVAVFSVPRGADRDVYALTATGAVIGLFGPSVAPAPGDHLAGVGTAADAILVPACDAGQAPQLVVQVTTAAALRLFAMPAAGGAAADYHGVSAGRFRGLALRGAGCVTELRADLPAARRPGIIADIEQGNTTQEFTSIAAFECAHPDPVQCRVTLPVARAGAALSAPGGIDEPRLTGMFVDATGVIMSSWVVLAGASGAPRLVERGRVPAAAIPSAVATGHFDADAESDLFWDLPLQLTSNFQVTYGRAIGGARLSAVSGAAPVRVDDLVVGDLTGDGSDDIVLVAQQVRVETGGVSTVNGIVAIPMNAPIPAAGSAMDAPCP